MKQQHELHVGYEFGVAHQAQFRAERAVDRLARQAGTAPRAGGGLGSRLQHGVLHARATIARAIFVPMRYTLSASDPTAQRTPGHTYTASPPA